MRPTFLDIVMLRTPRSRRTSHSGASDTLMPILAEFQDSLNKLSALPPVIDQELADAAGGTAVKDLQTKLDAATAATASLQTQLDAANAQIASMKTDITDTAKALGDATGNVETAVNTAPAPATPAA